MKIPLISVILPVYNCEEFLPEAIESILTQSFIDFELLIIDDGSTDGTRDIIKKYASRDHRIQAILNKYNIGIASSLNIGLANSRSPLIARMDADDVAHPDRLTCQYNFMQTHPEVIVCGSALQLYENREIIWRPPICHEDITVTLLFSCCLFHPTVIYKKDIILGQYGGYRPEFSGAEDYDLWQRLSENPLVRFANLPESLLVYRAHPNIDKSAYKIKQQHLSNIIRLRQLMRIGIKPNEHEFTCHEALSLPDKISIMPNHLRDCRNWLEKIELADKKYNIFSELNLHNELELRWLNVCLYSAHNSILSVFIFLNGRFSARFSNDLYQIARMLWRYCKRQLLL